MNYPESFIRGIPNDSFMEGDFPNATLFNNFAENSERTDDYNEMSINWNDDEDVMQVTFEQKKKDTDQFQFKVGAAIMSKKELDRLCKKPQIKGGLAYERREVPGNRYHGNLLLRKGSSKGIKNLIASSLALCVEEVEFRK